MKKVLIIGSLVLVGVLIFGAVGIASAQTLLPRIFGSRSMSDWESRSSMMEAQASGMMGGGRGQRGGISPVGMMGGNALYEYIAQAFADATGLTVAELEAQRTAGESYEEIAAGLGYTPEQVIDLMTQVRSTAVDLAVADGVLTQEQADLMLARMAGGMGGAMMSGEAGRGGYGDRQSQTGDGLLHDYMITGFAEAFDLDVADLQARIDAGETMYDVALSLNYTPEQFTELMVTVRTDAINQALADGVITQEQADWMLDRLAQRAEAGFGTGTCTGDCQMGGRSGGMRGGRGSGTCIQP